jgi:hypothetical protein
MEMKQVGQNDFNDRTTTAVHLLDKLNVVSGRAVCWLDTALWVLRHSNKTGVIVDFVRGSWREHHTLFAMA